MALPAALASLAVNLGVRTVAVGRFAVPAAALPLPGLFMASVMPVLGPAFGFYMTFTFRVPGAGSLRKFLLICSAFFVMGMLIQVFLFTMVHHNVGAFAVGWCQAPLATCFAVPALLRLVLGTARRPPASARH